MRLLTLLTLLFVSTQTMAQIDDKDIPIARFPRLVTKAPNAAGFVPRGWMLEKSLFGDLNGDGLADLAMLFRQTDPQNILSNKDGLGVESLNTNPRILAAAFADRATGNFALALENQDLIPRHVSPTLDDPFQEMEIVKGTLQVSLLQFASAGSWGTSITKFTLRHKSNCFQLIGYDRTETHRGSGEMTALSINYLTRKATVTTGNIENEKTRVRQKKVASRALLCVDQIGDGWEFDPQVQ